MRNLALAVALFWFGASAVMATDLRWIEAGVYFVGFVLFLWIRREVSR